MPDAVRQRVNGRRLQPVPVFASCAPPPGPHNRPNSPLTVCPNTSVIGRPTAPLTKMMTSNYPLGAVGRCNCGIVVNQQTCPFADPKLFAGRRISKGKMGNCGCTHSDRYRPKICRSWTQTIVYHAYRSNERVRAVEVPMTQE